MKVVKMKLSDLKVPERNVRIHTEKQLQEFERSIKAFDQIRPIVVDENNIILCGNGLYSALLRMSRETADVYKITNLSENQKKKLMIADNKIFGLGIDDLDTFNSFLNELNGDLDIPGFDEEILRSMTAEAEEITEKISEYGTIDEDEIKAIQASKERKERLIANFEQTPQPAENIVQPTSNSQQTAPPEETSAEVRKSVICPDCGCRIWL